MLAGGAQVHLRVRGECIALARSHAVSDHARAAQHTRRNLDRKQLAADDAAVRGADFAALKSLMNATDRVGDYYVFDIGGNKYRVIAAIHFDKQRLYVRHVFTHLEYDQWSKKK